MTPGNIYLGKFIKGKKIVDTSADSSFVNFYFEDGSYDVAPIIEGKVVVAFDEDTSEEEVIPEEKQDPSADLLASNDEEIELGFYKTLQPIPYTDQDGNEIGVTEVGSIQEVPVALGDFWVAESWAEKTEAPTQTLGQKIGEGISGLFGAK
jgi:hypothetical protein